LQQLYHRFFDNYAAGIRVADNSTTISKLLWGLRCSAGLPPPDQRVTASLTRDTFEELPYGLRGSHNMELGTVCVLGN